METDSPTTESKVSEDTNSPKDVELETEKVVPIAETSKVDAKAPVPEELEKPTEIKKSAVNDESSIAPVQEEKAKEEAKTESGGAAEEVAETAKSRPKEQVRKITVCIKIIE